MSLQMLWDAIQQSKRDMLSHFDAKVDPIQSSLTSIKNSMAMLGEQVQLLEQRVGAYEDIGHELDDRVKQLEKDNAYLLDKVDNLENRSRHSNLRFVGVQENAEGNDMICFMSRLIPLLLGRDAFPTPVVIERAHRSPSALQSDQAGPRSILIKLLNFQDKVKILCLARDKKTLEYQGKRIFIYPDFSPDLTKRRRSFDPVKRKLRELNLKYFVRFPATLCVVVDGKEQRFLTHKDAEAAFMSTVNSP